jgi:hypothetical protein
MMSNLSSSTNEANDEPFSNRFAFLTPDNVRAAAALVTVVASHTPSLLQHQRKFIEVVDAKTSSSPSSPSSSSSSSPASSKSLEEKKKTLDSGHQQDSVTTSPYRFVLDLDQLPSGPNLSWQIGKGHAKKEHHGVDLMLCHPNDLLNSRLVSQVVALISIHPASGAFMLQAISSRCPITYLSGDGNRDIVLKAGAKTVLHMTENRLRIGPTTLEALDYVLRIDVADEARFRAVRDEVLQYHVAPDSMHYPRLDPHWHLDALPKQAHHRVRDVVIHRTISSGAFGIVRSGVHTLTGAAVAIKTIHCKSRDVRSIKNELQIATLLARVCFCLPTLLP